MNRFARDSKMVLESPRLPTPDQIRSARNWLSNIPADELTNQYAALQQARLSLAIQSGKISKSEGKEKISFVNTPKEQMIEELLKEHLKMALGKSTVLGKQSLF